MKETPSQNHHLLTVWNPSYESDAMEDHSSILLKLAQEQSAGIRSEDDVFVYWGKVRSQNRQNALPHLDEILAIRDEMDATPDAEYHCYLTDYNSLYIAHLGDIITDDLGSDPDAAEHMPDYYISKKLNCDFWLQLWDIKRVVQNDTTGVVEELKKLSNVRYHDRPVSIYGGMVDLPLIVTTKEEVRWFDKEIRERLNSGKYWVQADAEATPAGEMHGDLQDNRFGRRLWTALDPSVRSFVATAEYIYRNHSKDLTFDLTSVVQNFGKAFEVQVNMILNQSMIKAPQNLRWVNVDGVSVALSRNPRLTLGALSRIIGEDRERQSWLATNLREGKWFAEQLPPILDMITEGRNDAAHGTAISSDVISRLRNQLIGVGSEGELIRLARVCAGLRVTG